MFPAGLCAATQICSSLTQTAQLPSGVRVASAVAVGEGADGGEARPGPSRAGGRAGRQPGVGLRAPAASSAAGAAVVGLRARASVGDLAALRAQLGDALLQQVEQLLGSGNGPGGQLEEGEHLRHGLDDLGDGRGARRSSGAGWASDQASKRATQPRSTALSSRSQARSRQPGRAVSPCSSTSPARRARSQSARTCSGVRPRARGGPFGGRVGERAPSRAVAQGGARRPSGRRVPRRPGPRAPAGQFRGRRRALGRAGRRRGRRVRHGPAGRRPGVAGGRVGAWSRAGYGTSQEQSCR